MTINANTVNYQAYAAAQVTRTVADKLWEIDSVGDFGAYGNTGLSEKQKLQNASNQVRYGRELAVPPGQYTVPQGGLVQSRDHDWLLFPESLIRGEYPSGGSDDLLKIRFTDVSGGNDLRNRVLRGGRFLIIKTPEDQAIYTIGGYAITVDATTGAVVLLGHRITGCSITGGALGAVRYVGTSENNTIAWSQIDHSTVFNGVNCINVADGMCFTNNLCNGPKPAYKFSALANTFCHTIQGGTIGNRDGALDVSTASLWRLINVQIEFGKNWQDEEQTNQQTLGAMVIIRGDGGQASFMGVIEKNNFGAGVGFVDNTVVIQNAVGTVIDENYFFLSDESDIRIESAARHTVVGTRNMGRGTRDVRATGQYTDASRRLVISMPADGSGNRARGTRGVWHPAANVLVSFQNTWAVNGMEVMLTETGLVVFNGGLLGGNTSGEICQFPDWLRPHQNALIHVTAANTGAVLALRLKANGVRETIATLPSVDLNFANATFMTVLSNPYVFIP